jgi:hypothetical protein
MVPLTSPTVSPHRQVLAGRNCKQPFPDRSNTFGETADFWRELTYDPPVVVVTCRDVERGSRDVLLSAPLGRLAGLGL